MRRWAIVVLAVAVVVVLWTPRPAEPPRVATLPVPVEDPFAADALRARLEMLAPIVSEFLGERVDIEGVRILVADDRVEARRSARAAEPAVFDIRSPEYEPILAVMLEHEHWGRWYQTLASYRPADGTLFVVPDVFDEIRDRPTHELLDVVLAHELVHVWQAQRYGAEVLPRADDSRERAIAQLALIEGMAEFVSRQVARRLDIDRAWQALSEYHARVEEGTDARHVARGARAWAYDRGYIFARAAHARWGAAAWNRLLSSPPLDIGCIERPKPWLRGERTPARDLDDWWKRFSDARFRTGHPVERSFPFWLSRPLFADDVAQRLLRAELDADAWPDARGGLLLLGKRDKGLFDGAPVLGYMWRFRTKEAARQAARTLEVAMRAQTPDEGLVEPVRERREDDGIALSWPLIPSGGSKPTEFVWAMRVQGDVVLEASTHRPGAAPALLRLLDPAISDRKPDIVDEKTWLASTHAPSDWLAALGKFGWEAIERGPILLAALEHDDPDVRRYALGAMAEGNLVPRPFTVALPGQLAGNLRAADPDERALALRAANKLWESVGPEHWPDSEEDPSSYVRATIAGCRDLSPRLEQLREDAHPEVRRIAKVPDDGLKHWMDRQFDQITGISSGDAEPPASLASTESMLHTALQSGFGKPEEDEWERLRRGLRHDNPLVRVNVLISMSFLRGPVPQRIVPELLDCFDSAIQRRFVVEILVKQENDLRASLPRLIAHLDHPRRRADALQILAADTAPAYPEVVERARRLLADESPEVRASASLYLLRRRLGVAAKFHAVFREAWDDVSRPLRKQLVRVSPELIPLGLRSPDQSEREVAVKEAIAAERWDDLLDAIQDAGPRVAREIWIELCEELEFARGLTGALTRRLQRWAADGGLPAFDWDWDFWSATGNPDPEEFRELLDAIDGCLRRSDIDLSTQFALALLRLRFDRRGATETPEVRAIIDEALSLPALPRDVVVLDYILRAVEEAIEERPSFNAAQVRRLLRHEVTDAVGGFSVGGDFEVVLGTDPERREAAYEMALELLRENRDASLKVAVDILDYLEVTGLDTPPALVPWESKLERYR